MSAGFTTFTPQSLKEHDEQVRKEEKQRIYALIDSDERQIRKEEQERVLDELEEFIDINEIVSLDEAGEESEVVVCSGEIRAKITELRTAAKEQE